MKTNLNQLPEEDRPRERLMMHGPQALSDAELLAILIGSGSAEETAVGLMQRLLSDCGNSLKELGKLSIDELCAYKGIGPAKAVTIMAASEFGRRRALGADKQSMQIVTSEDIVKYYKAYCGLHELAVEEFHVMMLNNNLHMIRSTMISRGGMVQTPVDLRVLMRDVLLSKATAIAVCHNHPSGSLHPSKKDDELTQRIKQAAAYFDIRLIDHVIIADEDYFSYADEGRL